MKAKIRLSNGGITIARTGRDIGDVVAMQTMLYGVEIYMPSGVNDLSTRIF